MCRKGHQFDRVTCFYLRVKNMSSWLRTGRFRSNKKRLGRIRWSTFDIWLMVLLALVILLAAAAGGWLGYHYSD